MRVHPQPGPSRARRDLAPRRREIPYLLFLACGILIFGLSACDGSDGSRGPAGPPGSDATLLEDGLNMDITGATIGGDLLLQVEYALADDEGNPVEQEDLDGPPRFGFAFIDVDPASGRSRYQSYVVNTRQGADYVFEGTAFSPALPEATQVVTDSDGMTERLGPGSFRYTFGTPVPADYDVNATHTVAAFVNRESRSMVGNASLDFVPSGAPMTVTREVVTTAACNQCHGGLAEHGGVRREIPLCLVCHTDQSIDPESGRTVEMGDMIHRIHRGADLMDLPYFIVGFRQSVHDYSDVHHPQDLRNCTTCHTGGREADFWKTRPSMGGCIGCHDEVNFATGEGHAGIIQTDNDSCSTCHPAEEMTDIDLSVAGVHTNPYKSTANPELTLGITHVENMSPGLTPVTRFSITDKNGPVDIEDLDRVALVFAGPTEDYSQLISIDHRFTIHGGGASGTLIPVDIGDYLYAPDGYTIPLDAEGTWSVGMEARTRSVVVRGESVRFGANNPVADVDISIGLLGQGNPVPRRTIVDTGKCNDCHDALRIHGELRTGLTYCTMCHNAVATDENRRPGLDPVMNPPELIDFKLMIHKIHRGEDLEKPYTVFGFGSTPHDYSGVLYPNDLRNCTSCHSGDSHLLPLSSDLIATVRNIQGVTVPGDHSILPPTTAACVSCHDGDDVMTHAQLNSIVDDETSFAESCTVCHGEGSSAGVSEVHKS